MAVVGAQDVMDGEVLEMAGELAGASVELLQHRMVHFVLAFHLLHQQFRIAEDFESRKILLLRVFQRGQQAGILSVIVGLNAEIFGQFSQGFAVGIADDYTIGGRAGIAARATVYIGRGHGVG